jgi:putative transport protein
MILQFVKDFGLILFVFSIGLQVGPGFFHSFKKDGLTMNMLAISLVLLAVLMTYVIHLFTGEKLSTMVGVMSGAVTNTPGLGAAQQAFADAGAASSVVPASIAAGSSAMASAYAVAYPIGVLGVILLLVFFKTLFKVDLKKESAEMDNDGNDGNQAEAICCQVENPAVFGKSLHTIGKSVGSQFVVSRLCRNGIVEVPGPDTVLNEGDIVLVVTAQSSEDVVTVLFGKKSDMDMSKWESFDGAVISRRLIITKNSLNGKKLRELNIRGNFGVNVTRVTRAGVDLVARPTLFMQVGDSIKVVGPERSINKLAEFVGNRTSALNRPNLIPIFFGIVCGIIFGSIPLKFPDIPQPVKLGIAGGPLVISILIGYFGPRWKITTYTTLSANIMIREIGISLFLAAVGIGAGETFIESLLNGGFYWILYGAMITLIPILIIGIVARYVFHLNFYKICGLISGGTTNPPVLSFAQSAYGTDYASVNYATVYPLTMFMRVLVAQLLVLIAF